MELELLFLRILLKNVTTSFYDANFIGLALKSYSINCITKGGVFWCLYPVNPITNESRLNLQMISTTDCYQLLLNVLLKQETALSQGLGRGRRRGLE